MKRTAMILSTLALTACADAVRQAELSGYDCAYNKAYVLGHTSTSCKQGCNALADTAEKQACFQGVRDGESDKKAATRPG